jgi:hypothetical protein
LLATLSAADEIDCGVPRHLIAERRSGEVIRSAPSVRGTANGVEREPLQAAGENGLTGT